MIGAPEKLKRPKFGIFKILLVAVLAFAVFFRIVSVVLFVATLSLYLFFPLHRSRRFFVTAFVITLLSFLSPIDLDIAGLYKHGVLGNYYGEHHSGPRLVRFCMGMPNVNRLVEKYGEFISGGCVGKGFEPKWIFVWS